jgi:hypothetical protein
MAYAVKVNMQPKSICSQSQYAAKVNMQPKSICSQSQYAAKVNIRLGLKSVCTVHGPEKSQFRSRIDFPNNTSRCLLAASFLRSASLLLPPLAVSLLPLHQRLRICATACSAAGMHQSIARLNA